MILDTKERKFLADCPTLAIVEQQGEVGGGKFSLKGTMLEFRPGSLKVGAA
jgi:hypothetical protein